MENKMVRKSNSLIEASYKLSAVEQKIILFLASTIKREDKDFKPYPIRFKDFQGFIGNKSVHYDRIEKMVLKLKGKNLKVIYPNEEGKTTTLNISWLSSSEYVEGSGVVNLCFDPKLKSFFLQLKNSFTNYRLKNVVQLKSQFSIRLYELLKQYEKIGLRLFDVADLRSILGIRKNQYKLYADFKRKVILTAQEELAEKTDISFEIEEIKVGRSVGKIRFFINATANHSRINQIEEIDSVSVIQTQETVKALVQSLPVEYREMESVNRLLKIWAEKQDYDYVARNIEYANAKSNAVNAGAAPGKGSNYRNYLAKALREDFGLPFKEDLEALNASKEKAQQREAEIKKIQKNQADQMRREQKDMDRARAHQDTLSTVDLRSLREEAFESLNEQQRNLVLQKATGSEMIIKIAMNRICLSRIKRIQPELFEQEAPQDN